MGRILSLNKLSCPIVDNYKVSDLSEASTFTRTILVNVSVKLV